MFLVDVCDMTGPNKLIVCSTCTLYMCPLVGDRKDPGFKVEWKQ